MINWIKNLFKKKPAWKSEPRDEHGRWTLKGKNPNPLLGTVYPKFECGEHCKCGCEHDDSEAKKRHPAGKGLKKTNEPANHIASRPVVGKVEEHNKPVDKTGGTPKLPKSEPQTKIASKPRASNPNQPKKKQSPKAD